MRMPFKSASRSVSVGALVQLELAAPTGLGRDRPDRANHETLRVQRIEPGRFRIVRQAVPGQHGRRKPAAFTQRVIVRFPHPKPAVAATHRGFPLIGAPSVTVTGWQRADILAQALKGSSGCRRARASCPSPKVRPIHPVPHFVTTCDPRCSCNTGR